MEVYSYTVRLGFHVNLEIISVLPLKHYCWTFSESVLLKGLYRCTVRGFKKLQGIVSQNHPPHLGLQNKWQPDGFVAELLEVFAVQECAICLTI